MRSVIGTLILTLLALPAGASAATSEPVPLSLKPEIVVEGPILQLSDIFFGLEPESRLAATPVAKAPAPGERVELSARWLAGIAKAYGLAWQPRSALEGTTVERASQMIEAPRIRAKIVDALAAHGVSQEFSLVLDDPQPRLLLPRETPATLAVSAFTYDRRSGRFYGRIKAPAVGEAVASLQVTGIAQKLAEVPVLRRALRPGDVIEETDVEWLSLPIDRLARNSLQDAREVIGMSPRRTLHPGVPLRRGDLEVPILVPKNSLVTIRLDTARMQLAVQGRALENGSLDEAIRVMNTNSNQVITGVVTAEGSVRVRGPAVAARAAMSEAPGAGLSP